MHPRVLIRGNDQLYVLVIRIGSCQTNTVVSFYIGTSVFIGAEYVNGKYQWKTTGQEVYNNLWAPNEPTYLTHACFQLWGTYGVDDTPKHWRERILCEKVSIVKYPPK